MLDPVVDLAEPARQIRERAQLEAPGERGRPVVDIGRGAGAMDEQLPQIGDELTIELARIVALLDGAVDRGERGRRVAVGERRRQGFDPVVAAEAKSGANGVRLDRRPSGGVSRAVGVVERELVEQAEGVAQAAGGVAGDDGQRLVGDRDRFVVGDGPQAADHGVGADAAEVEALAPGDDGRQQLFRIGRGEDEPGVDRRFFQRLEEGVGRRAGNLLRFVDDVELDVQLRRRVLDPFAQVANVVDAAIAGGVDFDDVGRRAARDGQAVDAGVAGATVWVGVEAIDRLGEEAGGRRLAGAPWAAKEIGVGDTIESDRVAQRPYDVFLPNQIVVVERLRPIFAIKRGWLSRRARL
jgi:hypothetical protein